MKVYKSLNRPETILTRKKITKQRSIKYEIKQEIQKTHGK
jgi:hypothetical protein